MKAKNTYKEGKRVELNDEFRKKLFQKLFKITSTKFLASKLPISRGTLYHYKNKRIRTIPLALLEEFIKIVGISKQELKNNIIRTISSKDLRHNVLKVGRKLRIRQLKKWKREIPEIEDLIQNNCLNVEKWFSAYRKLVDFGARKIISIVKKNGKIIIRYTNYVKKKQKEFVSILPSRIPLDEDFQYFFGLWCGDRAGGGRVGILNKQVELIFFAENFLRKLHQEIKFAVLKSSRLKKLPNLPIKVDKVWEVKNMAGDWVMCIFSVNGILKSFFDYLDEKLDTFLKFLPNRNIFFAGLFDAEGNVSLEDMCFRWSCKDMKKVEIYKKYLSEYGLFHRYDGTNLVTNNIRAFSKLILPYMKHKEKINKANLICFGKGNLDTRFKGILKVIKENEGVTAKELARILKRKKIYSQIRFLKKFNYVKVNNYPKRVYITQKGIKEIRGEGHDGTDPLFLAVVA